MYSDTRLASQNDSFIWKISKSSICSMKNKEYLSSPEFRIKSEDDRPCELLLYPNGKNKESEDFVSIYLHLKPEDGTEECLPSEYWRLLGGPELLSCKISIAASSSENPPIEFTVTHFNTGCDKVMLKADLFDTEEFFLNEELTVSCTVMEEVKSNSNLEDDLNVIWRGTLANDLNVMFSNKTFTDVVLKIGETEIHAHKLILASRSSVFESMFRNDFLVKETDVVNIADVEIEVFREVLHYVYTDKCSYFNVDFAMKLLAAADRYDIQSLKAECAEHLKAILCDSNVLDILISADAHGAIELRKICIDLMCQEMSSITSVPGWKSKFRDHPHILPDVLEQLAAGKVGTPKQIPPESMAEKKPPDTEQENTTNMLCDVLSVLIVVFLVFYFRHSLVVSKKISSVAPLYERSNDTDHQVPAILDKDFEKSKGLSSHSNVSGNRVKAIDVVRRDVHESIMLRKNCLALTCEDLSSLCKASRLWNKLALHPYVFSDSKKQRTCREKGKKAIIGKGKEKMLPEEKKKKLEREAKLKLEKENVKLLENDEGKSNESDTEENESYWNLIFNFFIPFYWKKMHLYRISFF